MDTASVTVSGRRLRRSASIFQNGLKGAPRYSRAPPPAERTSRLIVPRAAVNSQAETCTMNVSSKNGKESPEYGAFLRAFIFV